MIVRPRPNLLQLFFILRGSIVQRIFPQILVVAGLSAFIVLAHQLRSGWVPVFDGAPFALVGIALSIFLGFRNNACYDRWWEARRHWGELLFCARNLARQTLVLEEPGPAGAVPSDAVQSDAARRRLLGLSIAFAQALVLHLRPGGDREKVARHLNAADFAAYCASSNPPSALMHLMGLDLARLRAEGRISDILFEMLDVTLGRMAMVHAACERIRNTPVPFGYTLLLHRTAYVFCFFLPFGFADKLGWGTPFAAALVAYTFFGLDALGDELEEPFGALPNDLPIAALADTIELDLRCAMGETDLPAPPEPKDYILM